MDAKDVGDCWNDWYGNVAEFGAHGGCRDAMLKLLLYLIEESAILNSATMCEMDGCCFCKDNLTKHRYEALDHFGIDIKEYLLVAKEFNDT